jgi:hypothetical protein
LIAKDEMEVSKITYVLKQLSIPEYAIPGSV